MDPFSLIIGAGLLGTGWAIGRFGRRTDRTPTRELARCGCGHDLALHDRDNGKCHAEFSRKTPVGLREWVTCPCRRYTGPIPLEEVIAPGILPPDYGADKS